jgi:hypothetical protein
VPALGKSKLDIEISCQVLRQHDARFRVPGLDFDECRRGGGRVAALVAAAPGPLHLRHLLVLALDGLVHLLVVMVVVIIVSGARAIRRFAALRGRRQLNSFRLTHFMAEIVSHFIAKHRGLVRRRVIMVRHPVAAREAPAMRRRSVMGFY